jgi:hypothetical protein
MQDSVLIRCLPRFFRRPEPPSLRVESRINFEVHNPWPVKDKDVSNARKTLAPILTLHTLIGRPHLA